jgi:hypothetical protein
MTTALEGGEWSAARPGRTLPSGKTRFPLYRRLREPQGRSGRAGNLAPTGFDPRTVQPVTQSLYRLSYPAHFLLWCYLKIRVPQIRWTDLERLRLKNPEETKCHITFHVRIMGSVMNGVGPCIKLDGQYLTDFVFNSNFLVMFLNNGRNLSLNSHYFE